LKAPGTERLILKYDKLLSSVAFISNLRRYIPIAATGNPTFARAGDDLVFTAKVRRCRMT